MYLTNPYSLLGVVVLILDIIAIMSVLAGRSTGTRKAVWTAAILLFPFLGVIVYFLAGRSSEDTSLPRLN